MESKLTLRRRAHHGLNLPRRIPLEMRQNDSFETLCLQYPSWPELHDYLVSERGGQLRIVRGDDRYVIIRYVKGQSDLRSALVGQFRSVVWDTVANRPVSWAPPKAQEGPPPLHTDLAAVEDCIDGCMIQAFLTRAAPTELRLATRSSLGAENRFYSEKTFRALFEDALAATPMRTPDALTMQLREVLDGDADAQSVFVSFVVQHPEHRVVVRVRSPDLHIVHMGLVGSTGQLRIWDTVSAVPQVALRRLAIPRYSMTRFESLEEIQTLMSQTAVQHGFRWQGLVFKSATGLRWRLRAPSYVAIRSLRGAEATAVERFLRLRAEGTIVEYLKHYPEEKQTFWAYEKTLRARTQTVFNAYCAVHKAHTVAFRDLPAAYKTPVHHMHVQYLNELRPAGKKVLLGGAIAVVNGLKSFEQRRLIEAEEWVAAPSPAPTEV
jgi:hypothetical protein